MENDIETCSCEHEYQGKCELHYMDNDIDEYDDYIEYDEWESNNEL